MVERGIIEKKVKAGFYEVRLEQQSEEGCKVCALKKQCHQNNNIIVAFSTKEFSLYSKVFIDLSQKNEALRFFWVFFLPLFLGVLGMVLSFLFLFPKKELLGFLFFIGFFAFGIFFARLKEKHSSARFPQILFLDKEL